MAPDRSRRHIAGMNAMTHSTLPADELLWEQVLDRQPGEFLYAVTTMGV